MMGTGNRTKPAAILAGMLMAFALVAIFALPNQAMAHDLAATGLSAQSAYTNTSLANAKKLEFNEVYTGTMDYDETTTNTTDFEQYWFELRTSSRESRYAIVFDSVNASNLYITVYDAGGNRVGKDIWSGLGDGPVDKNYEAVNYDRVTLSSDYEKLGKNQSYFIRVSSTSIRNSWGHATCNRYDQYRLKFQEMRILNPEDVELEQSTFVYDGTEKHTGVTVKDGNTKIDPANYTVTYDQNCTDVGSHKAYVTLKGNYSGTGEAEFKVAAKPAKPTLTLSQSSYVYDGAQKTPAVTVAVDGTALASSEYKVTYADGRVDAGAYKVSVELTGSYSGSAEASFEIAPKAVTPTVTLSKSSFTYNGKSQSPAVKVTDGTTVLLEGADYTLSYSGSRANVGTCDVVVTLIGNRSGTGKATFTVNPKAVKLGKLTKLKKGFSARWSGQTSQATGYQLQYSTSKSFKNAKIATVKGSYSKSKTIKNLKAKKKYFVRVRAYTKVGKNTFRSSWSSTKSITTKSASMWTKAQKDALKKIEGTWTGASYATGTGRTVTVKIKDAKLKVNGRTIKITKVARFNENGKRGWKFFTLSNSWAYYLANGKPNELPIYMTSDGYGRISDYNMYSPTRNGLKRAR